jgi:hypothetical protein
MNPTMLNSEEFYPQNLFEILQDLTKRLNLLNQEKYDLKMYYSDLYKYYKKMSEHNNEIEKIIKLKINNGLIVPSMKKLIKEKYEPIFIKSKRNIYDEYKMIWIQNIYINYDCYLYYNYLNDIFIPTEIKNIKENLKILNRFIKYEINRLEKLEEQIKELF